MSNSTLLLIAIIVIMVAAVPFVALLKEWLPAQLERSANLEGNENRIYVLHSEIHEAQATLSGLTARRNQHSAENHRIDSETRKMEKAIREIENQPPLFVHEVGEPRGNLTKFLVNLTLTRASGETRTAPINPIWRCANVAEVWASSYDEAKGMVENAFPFKLGFNKSFVKQPDPKAKTAGAGGNGGGGGGGGNDGGGAGSGGAVEKAARGAPRRPSTPGGDRGDAAQVVPMAG